MSVVDCHIFSFNSLSWEKIGKKRKSACNAVCQLNSKNLDSCPGAKNKGPMGLGLGLGSNALHQNENVPTEAGFGLKMESEPQGEILHFMGPKSLDSFLCLCHSGSLTDSLLGCYGFPQLRATVATVNAELYVQLKCTVFCGAEYGDVAC